MVVHPSSSFLSHCSMDKEDKMSERRRRNYIQPKTLKRQVRFLSIVYVRETLSVKNYSEDEIQNTWYSKDENLQRKAQLATELANTDSKNCFRGLEGKSREGLQKRRLNKLCGWMSVFEEQKRQEKLGVHIPKAIATAYSCSVQKCCMEAYNIALLDELETWNFEL
jgi:hypothetical protein